MASPNFDRRRFDTGWGMKRSMTAIMAATALLAACAGRDPVPVSAYKPTDSKLSCTELSAEIRANNQNMVALAQESANTTDRNVMMGAAGVLLFAPILLAIDAKDAAATENRALEARNHQLAEMGRQGNCDVPAPYTVTMAEEKIGRSRSDRAAAGPVAGKDPQTSDASEPTARSAVPPRVAPPMPRGDLGDLMGQFLRGEISQEEYELARRQTASN